MIAAVETSVVAVGLVWIQSFRSVVSADIDTGAVTVVWRFILVASIVDHSVVTSVQVTVIVVVNSVDCLAVRLGVMCEANSVAPFVY